MRAIFLSSVLEMSSCPHCGKAHPTLVKEGGQ